MTKQYAIMVKDTRTYEKIVEANTIQEARKLALRNIEDYGTGDWKSMGKGEVRILYVDNLERNK
jgi:hypothetical protein